MKIVLTCGTTSNRELSATNECNCKIGYFNENNNPICIKCHYTW